MNLRFFVKQSLAMMLYHSGTLMVLARRKLYNKSIVLMYHRVIDDVCTPSFPIQPGMYVRKASFNMQVLFLKRHFHIISLDEMIRKLDGGEDITRCCSMTFDDGWKDNYDVAFPVLKRHGIPATMFLTTGYIGTQRWFWPEKVSWCLSALAKTCMKTGFPDEIRAMQLNSGSIEQLIDGVIERLKMCQSEEREGLVSRIGSLCQEMPRERLMMSWQEARAMLNSGLVTFGSHTSEHRLLHQLDFEDIEREVATSREDIRQNLSVDATLFAYPNGDFNRAVKTILDKHGFSAAVTTKEGYVCNSTPRLEVPRIGIHDDISHTKPLFYSRILLDAF